MELICNDVMVAEERPTKLAHAIHHFKVTDDTAVTLQQILML